MFTSDIPMHVLIDLGACHSFISQALAKVLKEEPNDLNYRMIIATPMGKSLKTLSRYKSKKIHIGETKLSVDLIHLEIFYFDVIVGIDFLTRYDATINYKTKVVSLRNGNSIIKFRG